MCATSFEPIEKLFDTTALAAYYAIVKRWIATAALCRNHRLNSIEGNLLADGSGVVATVGQQRPGLR